MKSFQKLALVAAIAAAPFAQAELVSMEDDALSEMTGQDGITIIKDNVSTSIDSVVYTDNQMVSDGAGGFTDVSGTLSINTIVSGGARADGSGGYVAGDIMGVKQEIDVTSAGGLTIKSYNQYAENILSDDAGAVASGEAAGIDYSDLNLRMVTVGDIKINDALGGATLISGLSMVSASGPNVTQISNDGTIKTTGFSQILDLDVNVDVAGIGIQNLSMKNGVGVSVFSAWADAADDTLSAFATGGTDLVGTHGKGEAGTADDEWIMSTKTITLTDGVVHGTWDAVQDNGWVSQTVDNVLTIASTTTKKDIEFTVLAGDVGGTGSANLTIGTIAINGHVSDSTMRVFGH